MSFISLISLLISLMRLIFSHLAKFQAVYGHYRGLLGTLCVAELPLFEEFLEQEIVFWMIVQRFDNGPDIIPVFKQFEKFL